MGFDWLSRPSGTTESYEPARGGHLSLPRPADSVNARQQAARFVSLLHIRIDARDELMMRRVLCLDAVERLAILAIGFAPDRVRNARFGHQVAFIRRID